MGRDDDLLRLDSVTVLKDDCRRPIRFERYGTCLFIQFPTLMNDLLRKSLKIFDGMELRLIAQDDSFFYIVRQLIPNFLRRFSTVQSQSFIGFYFSFHRLLF